MQLADLYASNRGTFMARTAVGGTAGTNPVGDRPGTTTLAGTARAWDTPAGRAHLFALGAFVLIVGLHLTAESRS